MLPGPPSPRAPRGTPVREVTIKGDQTIVDGDEQDVPHAELAARLPELASARILTALATPNGLDGLWLWENPGAKLNALIAQELANADDDDEEDDE